MERSVALFGIALALFAVGLLAAASPSGFSSSSADDSAGTPASSPPSAAASAGGSGAGASSGGGSGGGGPVPPRSTPPQAEELVVEDQGVMVSLGTPLVFPYDHYPLLRTNYFKGSPALQDIHYVQPIMTGFDYTGPEPRACFDLAYYDRDQKEVHQGGASLCAAPGDMGFVIEVLKAHPLGTDPQQGRALITASLVPV